MNPPRRHVFYLWHQWRREQQHHCSINGGSESVLLNDGSAGPQALAVNGPRHASEAMELDGGASLPDPRDSKRLKRGVLLPEAPALSSEYGFVSGILDDCRNPEQRRFATAYKKWIDAVVGQQP